jgi:excisionase family DNA binding protein
VPERWFTVAEAAGHAGVSVSTIYLAAQTGTLSGVKTGAKRLRSHWRFHPADVDKWLERGRVQRGTARRSR